MVNVINGRGRDVAGPIMETGDVAALTFIGTSVVANGLKRQDPQPNRLRCILGLDAQNPAIILEDAEASWPAHRRAGQPGLPREPQRAVPARARRVSIRGRKDSGEGTLSVSDALRCFSIRSMVAAPATPFTTTVLQDILRERTSNFVSTDYVF